VSGRCRRVEMSFTMLPPTLPPAVPAESNDAAPPDDDMKWRQGSRPSQDAGLDPATRKAAQLSSCEEKLDRAFLQQRPRTLLSAIGAGGGCTALKSSGRECAKCRVCPSEEAWDQISGYYRAQKGTIFICAEKEPTEKQVEDTLTQELVHAYDHCRFGMRVPLVGWQAPWALDCAATACSEVRAYLMGSFQRHAGGGGGRPGMEGEFAGYSAGAGAFQSYGGGGRGGFAGAGGSYGDAGVGFGSDGAPSEGFGGDGSLEDYHGAPAEIPQVDPDALRNAVYASALASVSSNFALNRCRGRADSRAVLDAVFNACLTDPAPLIAPTHPSGKAFPPMPPEVGAAEKGAVSGGASTAAPPVASAGTVPQAKWGEA